MPNLFTETAVSNFMIPFFNLMTPPLSEQNVLNQNMFAISRPIPKPLTKSFQNLGLPRLIFFCPRSLTHDKRIKRRLDSFINGFKITNYIFTSLRDGNRPHRIVGQPLVTANDVGH